MTDRALDPADPNVFDQANLPIAEGPDHEPPRPAASAAQLAPAPTVAPKPAEGGLNEPFPESADDDLHDPFPEDDRPHGGIHAVPLVGPTWDWLSGDTQHSSLARIMAAFGRGAEEVGKETWMSEETADHLRKLGVFNDYAAGQQSLLKAFSEGFLRSGAVLMNGAFHGVPALVHGAQEAVTEAGQQAEGTALGHAIGAAKLSKEIAAGTEAFPTWEFTQGTPHRPVGEVAREVAGTVRAKGVEVAFPRLGQRFPVPEPLEAATDLGVLKRDAQYKGLEPIPPEDVHRTAETAPAEAAVEAPVPDVHAIVRRDNPDLMKKFDQLKRNRDIFRRWINDPEKAPAVGPNVAQNLRVTEAELSVLQPQVDDAYAEARKGLPETEAITAEGAALPPVTDRIANLRINSANDVPYGAGADTKDPSLVHVDRHVPAETVIDGVSFDPRQAVARHEIAEHDAMEREGMPYAEAHKGPADDAERAYVEAIATTNGKDPAAFWTQYEDQWKGWLSHIEHEKPENPPPDLYTKPYPHQEAEFLRREAAGEEKPTEPAQAPQPIQVAPAAPAAPPRPIAEQQRDAIVADAKQQIMQASPHLGERYAEKVAELMATRYETIAQQFEGKLGTAEELYNRWSSDIRRMEKVAKTVQKFKNLYTPRAADNLSERFAAGRERAKERRDEGGSAVKVKSTAEIFAGVTEDEFKAWRKEAVESVPVEDQVEVADDLAHLPAEDIAFMVEVAGRSPLWQRRKEFDFDAEIARHDRGVKEMQDRLKDFDKKPRLELVTDDGRKALASKNIGGGGEPYRITFFDDRGPVSHFEIGSLDELAKEMWHVKLGGEYHFPGEPAEPAEPAELYQRRTTPPEPNLFTQREAEGQANLPGTERITESDLAKRRAAEPLKPGVAQKPMDVGLFSDQAKQRELFQILAYHGSPHHFERFSTEHIGTGEGAQAYGHGLYFAENEGVAKGYRAQLTRPAGMVTAAGSRTPGIFIEGKPFEPNNETIKTIVQDNEGEPYKFIPQLEKYVAEYKDNPYAAVEDAQKIIDAARQGKYDSGIPGALYRVSLKPNKEDLLDWDKPLSEQSEKVKAALKKFGIKEKVTADDLHKELLAKGWTDDQKTRDYAEQQAYELQGAHLYRELESEARGGAPSDYMRSRDEGRRIASERLAEAGIPGIKYADAGSRIDPVKAERTLEILRKRGKRPHETAEDYAQNLADAQRDVDESHKGQTHNFVIFDDKDVEITHRNGEPLTKAERDDAVRELYQRGEASKPESDPAKAFPEAEHTSRGEWKIPLANGKGAVEFSVKPDQVVMSGVYLDESEQGKGIASAAYRRIIDWALATDRTVRSNGAPRPGAARIYESLAQRGYDVERITNKAGNTEYEIKAGPVRNGDQTKTPEFKAWFGDSKAVDANGDPVVLFHGTDVDFSAFDRGKINENFPHSFGFHFTDRPTEAGIYAGGRESTQRGGQFAEGANIMPVFVRAENPLIVITDHPAASMEADLNRAEIIHKIVESRKAGKPYDSVIIKRQRGDEWDGMNVIVFEPEQVKSAIGNRGTFDPNDPNMLRQRALDVEGAFGSRTVPPRGELKAIISLAKHANETTLPHELGHEWLEQMRWLAAHPEAPEQLKADWAHIEERYKIAQDKPIPRQGHERFANDYLQWLREGVAPSKALIRIFTQLRAWMLKIFDTYQSMVDFVPKGQIIPLSPEMRQIFRRMHEFKPDESIVSAEREHLPDFHERHEKFAEEAPDHQARGLAENIQEERDSILDENLLKEENAERLRNIDAETRRRETGIAEPAGHADEAVRSGQAGPAAQGGTVNAGGGETASPGAGLGEEATGVGTGRAAPGPDGKPPPREGEPTPGQPAYAAEHYGNAESDLTDKIGNYRIDGLNHPDQILQALRENVAKKGGAVGQYRQGRAGLPASDGERLDLALAAGTPPEWLDAKKIGDAYNSHEIKALEELFGTAANAVKDAAALAKAGDVDAVLKHAEAMARLEMLQAHLAGATAEAGRSLAAVRSVVKKMFATTNDLDAFLRKETGRTLFQMQQMANMTGSLRTPGQVSRFIADTSAGKIKQQLIFYYVNALLSGPVTHLRYLVGNGVTALWAPLNTAVASGVDTITYATGFKGQTERKVFLGEAGAELWAIGVGSRNGIRAMGPAWQTGMTAPLRGTAPAELFDTGPQAARGAIGRAISIPSRVVSAIHAFSSSVRYEQELAKLAYRKAMQEKLDGQPFIDRVAELTDRPPQDHIDLAAKNALKSLYMAPADYKTFAGKLTVAFNHNLLSKIIVPFMQVGSQIESVALVESTPLGLFARRIREDLSGKNGIEARNERIAKNITATALVGTFAMLAMEGQANGDGPDDPRQREVWLRTHKPNSISIGPISVPFKTFGSLGVLMSIATNAAETARGWGKPEDGRHVALAFLNGMEHALLSESFLRGVKDMLDAVTHFEEYGDRFVHDMVTNWMPFSVGAGQITHTFVDPYQRETRSKDILDGIWKEARAKLPGASETLYPKIDFFGNPIPTGLAPIYRSEIQGEMAQDIAARYPHEPVAQRAAAALPHIPTVYADDPVMKALDDIHFGIARLPRKIRNVDLTDQQFYDFSVIAGVTQRMMLEKVIKTPRFDKMNPEARADLMHKAITRARAEAEKTVMMHATHSDNDIWKKATENKKVKKGLAP